MKSRRRHETQEKSFILAYIHLLVNIWMGKIQTMQFLCIPTNEKAQISSFEALERVILSIGNTFCNCVVGVVDCATLIFIVCRVAK